MNEWQRYDITLTVLTPVHIGTGDVCKPLEWFIDFNKGEAVVIDIARLAADLSSENQAKLVALADKVTPDNPRPLEEVQKLIARLASPAAVVERIALNTEMVRALRGKMQPQEARGADLMLKMRAQVSAGKSAVPPPRAPKPGSRPDNRKDTRVNNPAPSATTLTEFRPCYRHQEKPYLPGASIKGALRGAVLKLLLGEKYDAMPGEVRGARDQKFLESYLLQESQKETKEVRLNPHNDPFAGVMVSDFFPVEVGCTELRYATSAATTSNPRDRMNLPPSHIVEILRIGTKLEGTLTIAPARAHTWHLADKRKLFPNVSLPLIQDALARVNNNFGDSNAHDSPFALRLGRYTGREDKTLMGSGPATTEWRCGNSEQHSPTHQPFGWVSVGGIS